jgi:hypothetical protein
MMVNSDHFTAVLAVALLGDLCGEFEYLGTD